eukprot:RCo035624
MGTYPTEVSSLTLGQLAFFQGPCEAFYHSSTSNHMALLFVLHDRNPSRSAPLRGFPASPLRGFQAFWSEVILFPTTVDFVVRVFHLCSCSALLARFSHAWFAKGQVVPNLFSFLLCISTPLTPVRRFCHQQQQNTVPSFDYSYLPAHPIHFAPLPHSRFNAF